MKSTWPDLSCHYYHHHSRAPHHHRMVFLNCMHFVLRVIWWWCRTNGDTLTTFNKVIKCVVLNKSHRICYLPSLHYAQPIQNPLHWLMAVRMCENVLSFYPIGKRGLLFVLHHLSFSMWYSHIFSCVYKYFSHSNRQKSLGFGFIYLSCGLADYSCTIGSTLFLKR